MGQSSLQSASFGQSSFGVLKESKPTVPVKAEGSAIGRTFGSGKSDQKSTGFKALISTNQPSMGIVVYKDYVIGTNTFLSSGNAQVNDNEMGDDDEMFGGATQNTGIGQPKSNPFSSSGNPGFGFNAAGPSNSSSLKFDPKKPSFTQRRK
jgi:hypothetical protein